MMRRRGFRSRLSMKGQREQLHWSRALFQGSDALGFTALSSQLIFDPTTVVAGVDDELLTILRVKVDAFYTTTYSAAAAQGIAYAGGIVIADQAAGPANPNLSSSASERDDWMDLRHFQLALPGAANEQFAGDTAGVGGWGGVRQGFTFDTKAKRKIEQQEGLFVAFGQTTIDTGIGAPTVSAHHWTIFASVLWQRHRR